MKRIAVYCGSSAGNNARFRETASEVGRLIAEQDLELVYGGGSVGLMGTVADSVLENGGRVTGVIPTFLNTRELAHQGVHDLIVVDTMHERKIRMFELADGFLSLPGGFGTMEELFEMLAWSQLAIHAKPNGILNVDGYYDGLLQCLDHMVASQFLREEDRARALSASDPAELLAAMQAWQPPSGTKFDFAH